MRTDSHDTVPKDVTDGDNTSRSISKRKLLARKYKKENSTKFHSGVGEHDQFPFICPTFHLIEKTMLCFHMKIFTESELCFSLRCINPPWSPLYQRTRVILSVQRLLFNDGLCMVHVCNC